jgi:hypothetical protein
MSVSLDGINNICGLVYIQLNCGKETPPFMVFLFLKRNSLFYALGKCPYNPRRQQNTCTPIGVVVEPQDELIFAFEANTFPYLFVSHSFNPITLRNLRLKVTVPEYPFKSGKKTTTSLPKNQRFEYKGGVAKISDDYENMTMKVLPDGRIRVGHRTRYDDLDIDASTTIIGDGREFSYTYAVRAGDLKKREVGKFVFSS